MQDRQLVPRVFKTQLAWRIWHWNRTSSLPVELGACDRVSWIFMSLKGTLFVRFWHDSQWAMASSFTFPDHTQRRTTVGRTPLDEWSARCRDLYLTTHNTHNRQTSMPPVGFEPTISAGERSQTYALDRAATGTGQRVCCGSWNVSIHDQSREYNNTLIQFLHFTRHNTQHCVVSRAVPVGNVSWILFQEGRSSNFS